MTITRTSVEQHCPGCLGMRCSESLDVLPRFTHTSSVCSIVMAEAQTLADDHARHRRRGTRCWHRPATDAERSLVRAAGVHVDRREPLFARVDWVTPHERLRTFARSGLGSLDEVQS